MYIRFSPGSGDISNFRAKVLSLSGDIVRTLDSPSELDPGGSQAVWDLRDDAGRPVASGLYFYVVEAGNESARGTIAVMQ